MDSQELMTRLNDLERQKNSKYYHFKTVRNFILHLEDFPPGKKREEMYSRIDFYLSVIQANDIFTGRDSEVIYRTHITPLADYYSKKQGFTFFPGWKWTLFSIVFFIAATALITDNFTYVGLAVVFSATLITYFYKKVIANKVYGFFY